MDSQDNFENLPKKIQDYIISEQYSELMIEVGHKNRLHVDQTEDLGDIIKLYLVGKIKPANLVKRISAVLEVSDEKAKKIANELNLAIFSPIRESMKQETEIDEDLEREEMMRAISEQPEIPKVERTRKITPPPPSVSAPFPDAPAPNIKKPVEETIPEPEDFKKPELPTNIHEEKLSGITSQGSSETVINKRVTESLVPEEMKKQINEDPYKESIE